MAINPHRSYLGQADSEARGLIRNGFQEGVFEVFPGARREIVSEALVFASAQEARSQLATYLAEDLASFQQVGLKRYLDPAIPGSVVLGNFAGAKALYRRAKRPCS